MLLSTTKVQLQHSLLDAIAVAHEEVELDAGKQAHEYEHNDGIGTPWTAIVEDKAGNERNIGVCLSKSRDREEGKGCQVDNQAGAYD